ncbi:unnamed protein product [Sphenostylis stenocarpa]|uniref:Uncharacterized protein n=1 Tax=Sphenostylis stenocarpa TaxID=92480 RepID=A0AA86VBV3_9FABA|nr:unnamed protein product [Sphenostylis stenocarpa]
MAVAPTAWFPIIEGGECDDAGGEGDCEEPLGDGGLGLLDVGGEAGDFGDGEDEDEDGGGGDDDGGGEDGGSDDDGGEDGGGGDDGGGDDGGGDCDGGEDELSASSGVLLSGVESSGVSSSGELLRGEEDIITVSQNSHEVLNSGFRPKVCIQKARCRKHHLLTVGPLKRTRFWDDD